VHWEAAIYVGVKIRTVLPVPVMVTLDGER